MTRLNPRNVALRGYEHAALVGAPVHTALGKRIGYECVTSLVDGRIFRRQPLPMVPATNATPYTPIDIPNEGWLLLRTDVYHQLGGLNLELPPQLALMEYAIRVREAGFLSVSALELTLHRAAGYAETSLEDELRFTALRSEVQWAGLVRGQARRSSSLEVDVLVTGRGLSAKALLQAAGFPIKTIYWATEEAIPDGYTVVPCSETADRVLYSALRDRRRRSVAIIDLANHTAVDNWLLALVDESFERSDVAVTTLGSDGIARVVGEADTKATLIRTERIPVRIIPKNADNLQAYMIALCASFWSHGICVRQTAHRLLRKDDIPARQYRSCLAPDARVQSKLSIVVLSLGIDDVNTISTSRLRANTRDPYDLTFVVRPNHHDIIKRLKADSGIQVLIDQSNMCGGEQFQLALAHATGEHLAILRDDLVVPELWLDPLEAAMRRIPHAGIVAPRVSNGLGTQMAENERFANTAEFHTAARRRRQEYARIATVVPSLTHAAFLIRREVIERIGGIDARLAMSEYGIIDLCIRVQAAGYSIVIAEDALVHKIHPDLLVQDTSMANYDQQAAKIFARKWQLKPENFVRLQVADLAASELAVSQIYTPLPETIRPGSLPPERATFLLPLDDETAWQNVSRLIRKYQKTFSAQDAVTLAIGCGKDVDLPNVAQRVENIIVELCPNVDQSADVVIAKAENRGLWLDKLPAGPRLLLLEDTQLSNYHVVEDLSPAGLRQSFQTAQNERVINALS